MFLTLILILGDKLTSTLCRCMQVTIVILALLDCAWYWVQREHWGILYYMQNYQESKYRDMIALGSLGMHQVMCVLTAIGLQMVLGMII